MIVGSIHRPFSVDVTLYGERGIIGSSEGRGDAVIVGSPDSHVDISGTTAGIGELQLFDALVCEVEPVTIAPNCARFVLPSEKQLCETIPVHVHYVAL